jgi:hypothetical protein
MLLSNFHQVLSLEQNQKFRCVPLRNADLTFVYAEAHVIQQDIAVKKTIWRVEISRGNAQQFNPFRVALPP